MNPAVSQSFSSRREAQILTKRTKGAVTLFVQVTSTLQPSAALVWATPLAALPLPPDTLPSPNQSLSSPSSASHPTSSSSAPGPPGSSPLHLPHPIHPHFASYVSSPSREPRTKPRVGGREDHGCWGLNSPTCPTTSSSRDPPGSDALALLVPEPRTGVRGSAVTHL